MRKLKPVVAAVCRGLVKGWRTHVSRQIKCWDCGKTITDKTGYYEGTMKQPRCTDCYWILCGWGPHPKGAPDA